MNTSRCLYCRAKINANASKCSHCGSFQNWRRNIGFIATVVSLFLGLIATLGLIADPIQKVLTPDYSAEYSKFDITNSEYIVRIKNTGKQPFRMHQITADFGHDFIRMKHVDDLTFEAGKERFIRLTIPKGSLTNPLYRSRGGFRPPKVIDLRDYGEDLHDNCSVHLIAGGDDPELFMEIDETENQDSIRVCNDDFRLLIMDSFFEEKEE